MTIVELIVAISLLALVMTGLAASIGISLKTVQLARARQVAEAAANKRLAELRDVDYPQLALASMPLYNSAPNNPDHFVSGTSYDYTGKGDLEPMIVETSPPGPVEHFESPATTGGTVVDIYQFITWVDQPNIAGTQNLKRVTVVAEYHNVAIKGTYNILRESMVFTPGTVTVPSTSTTTTTSTTTPSTTTTTTVPSGGCGSFSLSGGGGNMVGFTATPTVTVTMSFPSSCGSVFVNFSNDGTTWGPDLLYDSANPTTGWTVAGGNGTRVISGRARNGVGGTPWILSQQSIILDTTPPTIPTTLSRTVSCSGSTRTVTLTWTAATDLYLVGYHVYASSDGTTYSLLSSASGVTKTTTNSKNSVVYYKVKAYDAAGNESSATSVIQLAKQQCS